MTKAVALTLVALVYAPVDEKTFAFPHRGKEINHLWLSVCNYSLAYLWLTSLGEAGITDDRTLSFVLIIGALREGKEMQIGIKLTISSLFWKSTEYLFQSSMVRQADMEMIIMGRSSYS